MSAHPSDLELLDAAARIVAAHVSHHPVTPEELPEVIRSVHAALSREDVDGPAAKRPQPAVPVKKSVFPDYIVCLEDGKKLKMLRRHLSTSYGMTPAQYRDRWDLPHDYPMVAPKHAALRSALAKKNGLGRKTGVSAASASPSIQRVAEGVRGKRLPKSATG